jgi:hypothetical protein
LPVAASAGAVQADQVTLQVVHPDNALRQVAIEQLPISIVAKPIQNDFQPVVAEIFCPDFGFQAGAQGFFPALDPFLQMAQAMVAFCQDIGQPN